jgi:hypothetical protein
MMIKLKHNSMKIHKDGYDYEIPQDVIEPMIVGENVYLYLSDKWRLVTTIDKLAKDFEIYE